MERKGESTKLNTKKKNYKENIFTNLKAFFLRLYL